jgi:hypothetical protein
MEENHAPPPRTTSPPPRRAQTRPHFALKTLWPALAPATRENTLRTLARIVAQQLPVPLPEKGVAHDEA